MVFLSIVVPVGIVGTSLHSALSGKPFGRNSTEMRIYQGSVRQGELWFEAYRFAPDGMNYESRIKRLNLAVPLTHGCRRQTATANALTRRSTIISATIRLGIQHNQAIAGYAVSNGNPAAMLAGR